MLTEDILIKSIVLLYRESLLEDRTVSNGKEVVKSLLDVDKRYNKKKIGAENDYMQSIIDLIYDMMSSEEIDSTSLLESFELISDKAENNKSYKILKNFLNADLEPQALLRSINSLRKTIEKFKNRIEIKYLVRQANFDITVSDEESSKIYVSNLIERLKALSEDNGAEKDPAIIDEIGISQDTDLKENFSKVIESKSADILLTGFKQLNKMLQGGFRRNELWLVPALQHNYKSGFLQSLFCQLVTLNEPKMIDPTKKPMVIYLSFEDSSSVYLEFMYTYLFYCEHREMPNIKETSPEDMSNYIKSKLTVNGYYPLTMKVNPSLWDINKLFNKMKQLENEGYELHCCIIDYITKLPTTGCDRSGPQGTDYRDMFQKLRDFFTARHCCCITGHQLSTEALALKRQNYNGPMFLKELVDKGYTELSKQIPHIVDGELYLTLDKRANDETYLCFQRGKHRIPTRISEKDKAFQLKFPTYESPMPENINDPDEDINQKDVADLMSTLGIV